MPLHSQSPCGLRLAKVEGFKKNGANFFLFFLRFHLHFFAKCAAAKSCACAQGGFMRYGWIGSHLRFGLPVLIVGALVAWLLGLV